MSGGSKQKGHSQGSANSTSGMGLHSNKPASIGALNSTKASHLARIPNASVVSAAPASHPPVLAQYGAKSLDNSQNNILDASTNAANNSSSNGHGQSSGMAGLAQRSLSRARQFGKDLTNMFTYYQRNNNSRQSSKNSASQQ